MRKRLPLKSGRATHFSEPGRHAFAANPEGRCTNYTEVSRCCGNGAGANGARIPGLPGGMLNELRIYDRHHLRNQLKSQNVVPEFRFGRNFVLRIMPFMPRDEPETSIPGRVRAEAKGVKAILHDSVDTLIDEDPQVFIEDEIVRQADPVAGGDRLVAEPRRRGYLAALVADWLDKSFENVHKALVFLDLFFAYVISRTSFGAFKPDWRVFEAATQALGLAEDDCSGCIMVGNNLERGTAGVNRLGIRSIGVDQPEQQLSDRTRERGSTSGLRDQAVA